MMARWQRRTGQVRSAVGHADRAAGFLEGALVVAIVESEPEAPDAVTVTIAVDDDERVAIVDDAGTGVVAGPPLESLAQALAADCSGQVWFEAVTAGEEAAVEQDPGDPFGQEIDVVSVYVPDRTVVFTRGGTQAMAALAAAIGQPLISAPHADGHLLLITDGPALGAAEWPAELTPALVIEEGAAYPAAGVVADAVAHVHTWDTDLQTVPGSDAAPQVHEFADQVLGTGALVEAIGRLLPTDAVAVRAAIESAHGPAGLIRALQMPEELVQYLSHGLEQPELPDAAVVAPASPVARAVSDAQAQVSESVREQTELMRERAEQMRVRAEAARVRAEAAFDAAETFTEEVVVPIRRSWWTPAVAVIEAVGGLALLHRAGRSGRAGANTRAGERVIGAVGVLLLVDAVVNTTLFLAQRLKREI